MVVIDYENCRRVYEAVDVALGSTCEGCGFSCVSGIVLSKVIACDRYACSPCTRADKRNVIFRVVKRKQ